jgi:hypothetical protein
MWFYHKTITLSIMWNPISYKDLHKDLHIDLHIDVDRIKTIVIAQNQEQLLPGGRR